MSRLKEQVDNMREKLMEEINSKKLEASGIAAFSLDDEASPQQTETKPGKLEYIWHNSLTDVLAGVKVYVDFVEFIRFSGSDQSVANIYVYSDRECTRPVDIDKIMSLPDTVPVYLRIAASDQYIASFPNETAYGSVHRAEQIVVTHRAAVTKCDLGEMHSYVGVIADESMISVQLQLGTMSIDGVSAKNAICTMTKCNSFD